MRNDMKTTRVRLMAAFAMILALGNAATADESISNDAIQRAAKFVGARGTGDYVLSFMHLGADYRSHKYLDTRYVTDSDGDRIPGEFAVCYRFTWYTSDEGETDVAFFCDPDGTVTGMKVLRTNAVIQQPFAIADATIQIVSAALMEAFGDEMTSEDRRIVSRLIQNADSKGLMEMGIRFRQAAGIR